MKSNVTVTVVPAQPTYVIELTQAQAIALAKALGPLTDTTTFEVYCPLMDALRSSGVRIP